MTTTPEGPEELIVAIEERPGTTPVTLDGLEPLRVLEFVIAYLGLVARR